MHRAIRHTTRTRLWWLRVIDAHKSTLHTPTSTYSNHSAIHIVMYILDIPFNKAMLISNGVEHPIRIQFSAVQRWFVWELQQIPHHQTASKRNWFKLWTQSCVVFVRPPKHTKSTLCDSYLNAIISEFTHDILLGRKKCRIFDRHLTHRIIWFKSNMRLLVCFIPLYRTQTASFHQPLLGLPKSVLHRPDQMVITWWQVWTIRWVR